MTESVLRQVAKGHQLSDIYYYETAEPTWCDLFLPQVQFYTKDSDLPYTPDRDVPLPTEKGARHSTVVFVDPLDTYRKVSESNDEWRATLLFLRDATVSRVETQFQVNYLTADGQERRSIFDLRVTYNDGFKVLVAYHPEYFVQREGLRQTNDYIKSVISPDIAQDVFTLTEFDVPNWASANAELIHSVTLDEVWESYRQLANAAASLTEPVSIATLCEPFGGTTAVFRTVVQLIYEGSLRQLEAGPIDVDSIVVNGQR